MCELLARPPGPAISLGGGAIGSARVRDALERHIVVLLDVDPAVAWQRAGGRRPLARDRERFEALHAERRPLYDALASAILTDSSRDVVRHAVPAITALRDKPAGTRMLWARSASGDYPVYVGAGLLRAPRAVPGRAASSSPTRTSARSTLTRVGEVAATLAVPPARRPSHGTRPGACCAGSRPRGWRTTTTWSRWAAASSATSRASAPRPTSAGCRSCSCRRPWSRRWTRPTAARPASTCPRARTTPAPTTSPPPCFADPSVLATLPPEELAAGWAEVIKTALIAGDPLWEQVRRGEPGVDADLVVACARTKLAVVARDERDAGRRQVLNLGHTVGHAIETATGYRRYRHGEAVGLGLLAALSLSDQPALRAEVAALLAATACRSSSTRRSTA